MKAGLFDDSVVCDLGNRDRASSKEDALNPGNNLYVTGLSTRVTEKDLEEHFSREGKVLSDALYPHVDVQCEQECG